MTIFRDFHLISGDVNIKYFQTDFIGKKGYGKVLVTLIEYSPSRRNNYQENRDFLEIIILFRRLSGFFNVFANLKNIRQK